MLKLFAGFLGLVSLTTAGASEYENTILWDKSTNTCADKQAPLLKYPITKASATIWVHHYMDCFFAWINDQHQFMYPNFLQKVTNNYNSRICFLGDNDEACKKVDQVSTQLNKVARNIDIHQQKFTVQVINGQSFRVNGVRFVKIDDNRETLHSKLANTFAPGHQFKNEFSERYDFRKDGTLERRIMITQGDLADRLFKFGLLEEGEKLYFAKKINDVVNNDLGFENIFGTRFNIFVVIALSVIMVALVSLFCMMYCLFRKIMPKSFAGYQKVKHIESDSDGLSDDTSN